MDGDIGERDSWEIGSAFTVVSDTRRACASRIGYPENGCKTFYGTQCVCDTDLCNDEVTATQSPPIECYECTNCDQPTESKCTGEVCIKDMGGAFTIYNVQLSSIIFAIKCQHSQTHDRNVMVF